MYFFFKCYTTRWLISKCNFTRVSVCHRKLRRVIQVKNETVSACWLAASDLSVVTIRGDNEGDVYELDTPSIQERIH